MLPNIWYPNTIDMIKDGSEENEYLTCMHHKKYHI